MSLLNDRQIKDRCWGVDVPMVDPFVHGQVTHARGQKLISSGLSSVGYDIQLSSKIKMYQQFYRHEKCVIDPANFHSELLRDFEVEDHFEIPPHGYVLGVSKEKFNMPENVAGLCLTKSTYARAGLLCNTTPLEPGWVGYLTLELANLTPLPLRVYVNQGIAQVLFFQVDRPSVTYADRSGKYQNQPDVPVSPRMKE